MPAALTRRTVLKAFAGSLALAGGAPWTLGADAKTDHVPWLAEVQQPPKSIPRDGLGRMEPLLRASLGEPISSLEGWNAKRSQLREDWLKFLGPMPEKRPAVQLTVLAEEQLDDLTRQLVRYEGEPGLMVEGYLLRPRGAAAKRLRGANGKLPGIVGLHQTTSYSIEEIAGVRGPEQMMIGLSLCRRGFVVFCPRCFLWQGHTDIRKATDEFLKRRPGVLGMRKMLYDAVRGVDVLAAQEDVDAERIGAVGHSLGAKEVLYLAAFDERVKAAVASEGGVGFRFTNWDAPWYLGLGIRDENFARNHHELIALTAPRALLILAGESGPGAADGDRTWPFLEAALPVYRLYGPTARLGLLNHRQGHSIPPDAAQKLTEWLETYLKPTA